jgi:aspartate carbamoyltransferase catalytic subunit
VAFLALRRFGNDMDFIGPQNILGKSDCFEACRDGLVQAILSEEDEVRRVVLRVQAEKQEPQNVLQP